MKARNALALLCGCLIALTGCDREARMSELGFRLPDGDAVAGRATFVYMQCHQCHTVIDEEFPEIPGASEPYVQLGGEVGRVKTYGDLVTSIINPSHRLAPGYARALISEDGESKMYRYNAHMTVQELVDIVMFLQPKYDVRVPEYHYRMYPTT